MVVGHLSTGSCGLAHFQIAQTVQLCSWSLSRIQIQLPDELLYAGRDFVIQAVHRQLRQPVVCRGVKMLQFIIRQFITVGFGHFFQGFFIPALSQLKQPVIFTLNCLPLIFIYLFILNIPLYIYPSQREITIRIK